MRKKLKPLKALQKKADTVFSLYIRNKYADWKGDVRCYTCNVVKPIKQMQCGHFISRARLATRYDEGNCRAQCAGCNVFKHGNYPIYAMNLVREKGKGILEKLDKRSRGKVKSRELYESVIEKYEKQKFGSQR